MIKEINNNNNSSTISLSSSPPPPTPPPSSLSPLPSTSITTNILPNIEIIEKSEDSIHNIITREDNIKIHYWIYGIERPIKLVFISGHESTHYFFEQNIEFFYNHPSKKYSIMTIDNRGVGQSSVPPGPYTTQMMGKDVIACINDAKWLKNIHIIGISMGGMIAQEVAIEMNQESINRIETLTLCSTHSGEGSWFSRLPTWKGIGLIGLTMIDKDPERVMTNLLKANFSTKYFEEKKEYLIKLWNKRDRLGGVTSIEGSKAQLEAINNHNASERLHSIRGKIPVLVLVGTSDDLIVPSHSYRIAQQLNCKIVTFNGAGHSINDECLDKFNEELLKHIDNHKQNNNNYIKPIIEVNTN
jgi:pimeloyl-ACP methyl ester carboxylesterase